MTSQTKRRLPEAAYATLRGFKGQSAAALDKACGREALREAQRQMAADPQWRSLIYKALMQSEGGIDAADDDWLERTFADHLVDPEA